MYSVENVHDRFSTNPPNTDNSNNLIAVRYNTDTTQWEYNDDTTVWRSFTLADGDRLLASLDFDNANVDDKIASLEGTTGDINGIEQGFIAGDLTFKADYFDKGTDTGEFKIEGSHFSVDPIDSSKMDYRITSIQDLEVETPTDKRVTYTYGDYSNVPTATIDEENQLQNLARVTKRSGEFESYDYATVSGKA